MGQPRTLLKYGARKVVPMMGQWWTKHVAWRFMPTPATPKAVPTPATPKAVPTPPKAASPMEGGCSKCLRPREDKSFKLCARCRTMASVNAVRRRKVLQRKGACPKCSGPRDGDNLVCSGCLAKARKRYHQRKADRAKMAPAP